MILSIAARELRGLFLSPLAWTVLAIVQLVLAWVFLVQVDWFLEWQARLLGVPGAPGLTEVVAVPLLRTAAVVMLLVTPLLTMRLVSEERRNQTLPLLLAAPVSMTQIVLGKYLGVMGFLLLVVALVALMPLSLLAGGGLDTGMLASGLLGLTLVLASFAAAGLFMSTLTEQPMAAAVSTFGLLLLLWLLDWAGGSGPDRTGALLAYASLLGHYEALIDGLFDTRDLAYYLLFSLTFLGLAVRRLDSRRLGQ